ncbi:hypothetical protein M5689_010452 [Euphorbia peplus]|nr:hypothetical protein M5689_010452 [Euphorbia peplus]
MIFSSVASRLQCLRLSVTRLVDQAIGGSKSTDPYEIQDKMDANFEKIINLQNRQRNKNESINDLELESKLQKLCTKKNMKRFMDADPLKEKRCIKSFASVLIAYFLSDCLRYKRD